MASLGGHNFNRCRPPSFSRAVISSLCLSSTLRQGLVGASDSFLQQVRGGFCIWHRIRCHNSGNCLALREINSSRCHVLDYDGNLVASWFHLSVSSRDVDPIRQGRHIVQVWGLGHDVQSMIHHHSSLGMAVYDDRFKGWYCTLTGEGDGFIQISRVFASVSGESPLWFQV